MAGLLDFLRQNSPTSGLGQMSEAEMERLRRNQFMEQINMLNNSPTGLGQLSEAEAAALKFQQMKAEMDEMSRIRQMSEAYGMGSMSNGEGNTMVNAMRQMNPEGNTMQYIPPSVGGMSARNAQPSMNLNTLLKMLGY